MLLTGLSPAWPFGSGGLGVAPLLRQLGLGQRDGLAERLEAGPGAALARSLDDDPRAIVELVFPPGISRGNGRGITRGNRLYQK